MTEIRILDHGDNHPEFLLLLPSMPSSIADHTIATHTIACSVCFVGGKEFFQQICCRRAVAVRRDWDALYLLYVWTKTVFSTYKQKNLLHPKTLNGSIPDSILLTFKKTHYWKPYTESTRLRKSYCSKVTNAIATRRDLSGAKTFCMSILILLLQISGLIFTSLSGPCLLVELVVDRITITIADGVQGELFVDDDGIFVDL
jgi:hypothetical protein